MDISILENTSDVISRQAAIDALEKVASFFPYRVPGNRDTYDKYSEAWNDAIGRAEIEIEKLQSTQPEIIRCKDCNHWNLQVGNVKGDGLGSCDFHNVNLVTGEGFCYWADRRGEKNGNVKS